LVSKGLKKPKKLQRNNSLFLIILGLLIFIFGGINYYRVRILSFSNTPQATLDSVTNTDIPSEVIIPSIDIDLKIEPGKIKNDVWEISALNATYLNISSPPGSGGNTVIYGHNKKAIFGNLPYLSIGQKITVKTVSGNIYNYVVDSKYFVSPDKVEYVSPTVTEQLTLYTCWGLFDSQRAVIIAKPQK